MKDEMVSPPLPGLKGRFPFRLGTSSYILPDALIPNIEFLGPLIDDVELVLFESGDLSNLPDECAIHRLLKLKETLAITYTIHLPLDIHLGSRTEGARARSLEKCREIIDLCEPLDPVAYVVHFHGDRRGPEPSIHLKAWLKQLDRSSRALVNMRVPSQRICVETLDYPFALVEEIVFFHGMSVCLDVGHLALHGYPIAECLGRYLERSPVIHLHGFREREDHRHIGLLKPGLVSELMRTLTLAAGSSPSRVLTLEVFGLDDFSRSMAIMREMSE